MLALPAVASQAWAQQPTVFLSTQLRPVETAQIMRTQILKDYAGKVDFVPEQPPEMVVRMQAEKQAGRHTISLLAGVHSELQPLVPAGILTPLNDVAESLKARGFAADLMDLGKFGTPNQLMIPWMQATYVMVANKKALPHLPAGADINKLTYAQLAEWGANLQKATGRRVLGFPAGPKPSPA